MLSLLSFCVSIALVSPLLLFGLVQTGNVILLPELAFGFNNFICVADGTKSDRPFISPVSVDSHL
jgi:hypothetical protein